jgi:hypothetical protein
MGLKKEIRYLIIAQGEFEGKTYSSSNKNPHLDLEFAKKTALDNFPVNIKTNICLHGYKYIYAEVPIYNIIMGTKYELQPIYCKVLTQEELNL